VALTCKLGCSAPFWDLNFCTHILVRQCNVLGYGWILHIPRKLAVIFPFFPFVLHLLVVQYHGCRECPALAILSVEDWTRDREAIHWRLADWINAYNESKYINPSIRRRPTLRVWGSIVSNARRLHTPHYSPFLL
jgi:hypothetical protein